MSRLIAIWVSAGLVLTFYLAQQRYGDTVLLGALGLVQALVAFLFWTERRKATSARTVRRR